MQNKTSNSSQPRKRLPVGRDISTRRRQARKRRHGRLRSHLRGTNEVPRLAVHRSTRHIHVQLIDDINGKTLASASTMEPEVRAIDGDKKARSSKVGELIAQRAKKIGIEKIKFDRGGYKYHGRVAAVADAAREGGLNF